MSKNVQVTDIVKTIQAAKSLPVPFTPHHPSLQLQICVTFTFLKKHFYKTVSLTKLFTTDLPMMVHMGKYKQLTADMIWTE